MPSSNSKTQETQVFHETIVIHSVVQEEVVPAKTVKICWNTGEEKNCRACYLSKGCKARA